MNSLLKSKVPRTILASWLGSIIFQFMNDVDSMHQKMSPDFNILCLCAGKFLYMHLSSDAASHIFGKLSSSKNGVQEQLSTLVGLSTNEFHLFCTCLLGCIQVIYPFLVLARSSGSIFHRASFAGWHQSNQSSSDRT